MHYIKHMYTTTKEISQEDGRQTGYRQIWLL